MNFILRFAMLALSTAVLISAASSARALDYPKKPIRIIVPFPPGGGTDFATRVIGQKLTESWGQQVVVENKGGAGGTIAAAMVAKAEPDGYTLFMGVTGQCALAKLLFRKLPYDPDKDFEPITLVGVQPFAMVVHPSVPVKSVKEFVALAKSKPGKLNYGHSGIGSVNHLTAEMFKLRMGIDVMPIPYKGGTEGIQGLLSAQVDMVCGDLVSTMPHVKAGKLRGLAMTSIKRSTSFPDLPTIAEAAPLPGFDAVYWVGFLAPAGTPKEIITKIKTEVVKILQMPDVKERLQGVGFEIMGNTPEQFAEYIKAEIVKWGEVVKYCGAQID